MTRKITNGAHQLDRQALHSNPNNDIDGMKSIASLPEVLTLGQCCSLLQIAEGTARSLCRQNKLPGIKIGGVWRVPKAHLLSFIARGGQ